MNCRFCNSEIHNLFVDLLNSPPSNSFLTKEQLDEPETYYPLKVMVCHKCFLVQIQEYKKSSEIFNSEYAYYSSYSKSWLEHCRLYTELVIGRFELNNKSFIVEIASNDGYLLQYFKAKGFNVLGIEPSSNTAQVAKDNGIPTLVEFFGESLAKELKQENKKADLLIGNNVLAHVPDINDFVKGLKILLSENGVITMEFPHLFQLVTNKQFDTIYHEHYSYFSFYTINNIFENHGLEIFDVEEIPTHGGSIRIFARHLNYMRENTPPRIKDLILKENEVGIDSLKYYINFQPEVNKSKLSILSFLTTQKMKGRKIVAYGAAAKGNTMLNYCGIKRDIIEFVVDANPYKQNKYLPGSHIPILKEQVIKETKPDFILILPWNLKEEIINQLAYVKNWNCQFVIPIPSLTVI